MPVRGSGIRDVATVLCISVYKVLITLAQTFYDISPKKHYSYLEIDEFWTYIASKSNKRASPKGEGLENGGLNRRS